MDRTAAYLEAPLILVFCVGVPALVLVVLFAIYRPHRRRQQRREREVNERNRQRVAWYIGTTAAKREDDARRAAANLSTWDAEAQLQLAPCVRSWPRDMAREPLPAYELDPFTDHRTIAPRTEERTWFT